MSLILMEGFESRRSFQDWINNRPNWVYSGTVAQPLPTFPTSRMPGEGGSGFCPFAPVYSYANFPSGGSGALCYAYNPNLTVNQAWLNGGMTMGMSARMTSSTLQSIGTTYYNAGGQLGVGQYVCFDGTYYYALQTTGSTNIGIVRSTDLIHWTLTSAQPPLPINWFSSIAYANGAVAVIGTAGTAAGIVYYSTDQGNNWKSYQLTASTANPIFTVIATGNPTYPVLIFGAHAGPFYIFVGNWTTGFTQVVNQASLGGQYYANRPKIVGNTIICPCNNTASGSSIVYTANVNSALNVAGSWTSTSIPISFPSDWAYNPNTNIWNVANNQGIWMVSAGGTTAAPTFGTDCVLVSSQTSITNLAWNGKQMVGNGLNSTQVLSTDSRNWVTFPNHQIFPEGVAYHWLGCYYDGSRYILTTDPSSGFIVTTPDMVNDYQVVFIGDLTPSIGTTSYWTNIGFWAGSALQVEGTNWVSAPGMWHTPVTGFNLNALGLNAAGNLQLTLATHMSTDGSVFTNLNTVVVVTSDTNYFELQMIPAATSNTFMFYLYVNGSLVAQSQSPLAMATAGNTTAPMYVFPTVCNGTITQIDDLYICLNDGKGVSGRLGPCSIVARRPTADVQATFGRVGDRATNSLTINQNSATSHNGDFLTSPQTNQADVYTSSDPVQAKSTVRAVQLEASIRRLTSQPASAVVGMISPSTQIERDSPVTPIAGPVGNLTAVTSIFQTDPDGNNWTLANALAAPLTINHTN